MFVMPSITIINNSGVKIEQAEITLPANHLDFGTIANNQQNTLHYALNQSDGSYHYTFKLTGLSAISDNCGYVTQNEIHKRVFISINHNFEVICQSE
jgi:hypothetical protein